MPELIEEAMRSGRARITSDAAEAVADSEISFVVSAPRRDATAPTISRRYATFASNSVAQSETKEPTTSPRVAPGTTEDVLAPILEKASGKRIGRGLHVCFQPEFLREGVSIKDFENSPMTIVGGEGLAVDALRTMSRIFPVSSSLPAFERRRW